jgi:hypothetical protein
MFANPLWSVAILLALVLIYRFIISPRLRVRFSETYTEIDGFWARLWTRIYAFRQDDHRHSCRQHNAVQE